MPDHPKRLLPLLFLAAALGLGATSCQNTKVKKGETQYAGYNHRGAATGTQPGTRNKRTTTATTPTVIPESQFSWWDENGRHVPTPQELREARRAAKREQKIIKNNPNYIPPPDPGPFPLSVTIDLSEQAAHFYRGPLQVGRSRVATGRRAFPTPTGRFRILEKKRDKRSNLYGRILDAEGKVINYDADARTDEVPEGGRFLGASMPNWMRLTGAGVGMHAGPIPRPGSPASHGCIRLPAKMARLLYEKSKIGTPVTIVP